MKAIGTRPARPDGVEKVTGRARFGADWSLSGMLHGKVLRSPHAHAKIRRVELSSALALDGVFDAVCGHDFSRDTSGDLGTNIMARDKAMYHGHAVAAVAATSPALAELALSLIHVEYEPLEPVLSLAEAMDPDSVVVNETVRLNGDAAHPAGNIAAHRTWERGSIRKGFKRADHVADGEFSVPMAHQAYIEPHACMATMNEDGKGTIWCCTQGHFDVRDLTAQVLGKRAGDIRVVATEIGGGFGGKTTIYLEPVALLMAERTGRPVKMVMSREEVFRATGPASATQCRVKLGATSEGRIIAATAWLAYEAGAFPGSPMSAGCQSIFAPYDLKNFRIDGYDVIVNKPRVAAYRAPGAPQAAHAMESVVDDLARLVGMDPIEFRLKNAAKEGTQAAFGPVYPPIGLLACLEAARDHPAYLRRSPRGGGRGVAVGFWFNAGLQSSAEVRVAEDGSVKITEGNPDIGGSRASMCLMAAETLGVAYECIDAQVGDTDSAGFCRLTGGSRTTFATGMAVVEACKDVIQQCCGRAAAVWELDTDQVEWSDGHAVPKPGINVDLEPMSFAEIARDSNRTGGPLLGRASLNAKGPGASFSVNWTDVEVDRETGKVDIKAFTAIQDAGTAIHPSYVEGQMQGGAAQGIGWALNEEYIYDDDGVMENASFLDYRIPVASDLPMIDTQIVEVPNPSHPYGVRGVGETPIVAPMAAVANAVRDALGFRICNLPLSPPRVLKQLEIHEAGNRKGS